MEKQAIFTPRKTWVAGVKGVRKAVKDLGLEVATQIGIELLKVDGLYYTVKNPTYGKGEAFHAENILSTESATERYTAKEVMELIKA
jgi:hypothetical protein